jgi:hypothetical protein
MFRWFGEIWGDKSLECSYDASEIVAPREPEARKGNPLKIVGLESSRREERRDIRVQPAATRQTTLERGQSALPLRQTGSRSQPVFDQM